jgi:Matrixin
MTRPALARLGATLLLVAGSLQTGQAYLRQSNLVGDSRVPIRWGSRVITYSVSNAGVPGVSVDAFEAALQRAAQSWEAAPGSNITFQYSGRTSAHPLDLDGRNTIGFLNIPELVGVLGVTATLADVVSGEIVESDMFLNAANDWSVAGGGEEGAYDVESIALHELGHMLGLDHSALGYFEVQEGDARLAAAEAVMFPFAFDPGITAGRVLKSDDIAGVAAIYPDADHQGNTGTIRTHVQLGGRDVFGAHVMAFNPITGSMVAGFVLENGEAVISGLEAGPYVLRVEPVDDDDTGSYFEEPPAVDLAFRNTFIDRLIYVQRGGTAGPVEIVLEAR